MAGAATTGAATIGEGAAARSDPPANPGMGGGVNGRLRLGFTSVEDGQRKESTKRPRGFVLVDDFVASSDFATALSAGDLISPTSSAVNATSPALNRANRAAILMREVDIFMAASKLKRCAALIAALIGRSCRAGYNAYAYRARFTAKIASLLLHGKSCGDCPAFVKLGRPGGRCRRLPGSLGEHTIQTLGSSLA